MVIVADNVQALRVNPYPGRGFVVGMTPDEKHVVQVYWLMGRSENSRNRIFVHSGSVVFTETADPSKVTDPSLTIYNAMKEGLGFYIVSNGNQTDTLYERRQDGNLLSALARVTYEPDEPNFTPRITALTHRSAMDYVNISVLSRSPFDMSRDEAYYGLKLNAGYGYCVHTYAGDGNPLPSFLGRPFIMPLVNDIELVSAYYWDILNKENRVALVTKFIDAETGVSKVHILNGRTN